MKNNTGLKNSKEGNIWTMLYKWYKNMTLFSKSVVLRKNSELQRFP